MTAIEKYAKVQKKLAILLPLLIFAALALYISGFGVMCLSLLGASLHSAPIVDLGMFGSVGSKIIFCCSILPIAFVISIVLYIGYKGLQKGLKWGRHISMIGVIGGMGIFFFTPLPFASLLFFICLSCLKSSVCYPEMRHSRFDWIVKATCFYKKRFWSINFKFFFLSIPLCVALILLFFILSKSVNPLYLLFLILSLLVYFVCLIKITVNVIGSLLGKCGAKRMVKKASGLIAGQTAIAILLIYMWLRSISMFANTAYIAVSSIVIFILSFFYFLSPLVAITFWHLGKATNWRDRISFIAKNKGSLISAEVICLIFLIEGFIKIPSIAFFVLPGLMVCWLCSSVCETVKSEAARNDVLQPDQSGTLFPD